MALNPTEIEGVQAWIHLLSQSFMCVCMWNTGRMCTQVQQRQFRLKPFSISLWKTSLTAHIATKKPMYAKCVKVEEWLRNNFSWPEFCQVNRIICWEGGGEFGRFTHWSLQPQTQIVLNQTLYTNTDLKMHAVWAATWYQNFKIKQQSLNFRPWFSCSKWSWNWTK